MARLVQIFTALVLCATLGLTACGRKGPLEAPPTARPSGQGGPSSDGGPPDRRSYWTDWSDSPYRLAVLCTILAYKDGVLHAEEVSLDALAREVGTPLYCYSSATLERHYQVFEAAFEGSDTLICYSVKANSNQAVLGTLGQLGAGMDVVSEGELRRAIAAEIPGERIVFSGVGKTAQEMRHGLEHGIYAFNVESRPNSKH